MRSLYKYLKSKRVLTPVMALLILGTIYLLGFRIPCVFYNTTTYLCPGCGITRMCEAILHLDFIAAFGYNQLCFALSLVLGPYFVYYLYMNIKGRVYKEIPRGVTYIILGITILFWILRNLSGFEYLRP